MIPKSKKTLFFYIKSNFRERQWDTVEQAKKIFNVITLRKSIKSDSQIINKYSLSLKSKIKNFLISKLPLINFKYLPKETKNSDFIYLWNAIPLNFLKKKFIIEFDNPFCLTFYNYKSFKLYKKLLFFFIEKASRLTFMSETAKRHFLIEFNNKFEEKSFVVYPYVSRNYILKKNSDNSRKREINFIFVAFNSKEKGGVELVKAFNSLKIKNIKLHIYTSKTEEIKKLNISDERIIINPPVKRTELINKIFPNMDVLVLPTFYESFGLVILEALSCGLGIITTNVYATQELVKDNKNGVLLKHPFLKPAKISNFEFINNVKYRAEKFYKKFLKNNGYLESFSNEIKEAIKKAINNYKSWQEESIKIYEEKFSEEIWLENFKKVFNE